MHYSSRTKRNERPRRAGATHVALWLTMASSCLAGSTADNTRPPPQAIAPEPAPDVPITVSKLLQREVVNSAGIKLAHLDELVMDNAGRVRYAILSSARVLNIKEHILVPWQAIHLSIDHPFTITLDMTAQELKRAPRADRMLQQDWTSLDNAYWREVDRHYVRMFAARGNSLSALKNQFELLDRDHNGLLSPQEAALLPRLSQNFQRADINQDQYVDEGEFARFEAAARGPDLPP